MKRLSTGFAGGSTKQFGGFDREVEQRLGKLTRLDVFTDDFSPPGASQKFPGADFSKRNAPYGKPHDDTIPENTNRVRVTNEMAEAGDPKTQAYLDELDRIQNKINAPIKNPYDQFPGALNMDKPIASETGPFDVHATDPRRLGKMPFKSEAQRGYMHIHHPKIAAKWDKISPSKLPEKLTSEVGPEEFHAMVEHRMSKMVSGQTRSDNPDLHDQRIKK